MAEYPVPPWLRGVGAGEIGQLYSSGVHTGAGIAEAQQRMSQQLALQEQQLAQEKEVAQMRLDAQQKVQEQENARKVQEMAMTKAYHDQTIDLRKSQVQEAQQKLQAQAQLAATQFAARQRAAQRIAGGEDAAKVWLEEGPQAGGIGATMGAAALRSTQSGKEYGGITTESLPGGATAVYRKGSPGLHVIPPEKSHEITATALASLAKTIPSLQTAAKLGGTNSLSQKVLDKIMPIIQNASQSATAGQSGGATRTVKRNPKTGKFELVKEPQAKQDPLPDLTGMDEEPED